MDRTSMPLPALVLVDAGCCVESEHRFCDLRGRTAPAGGSCIITVAHMAASLGTPSEFDYDQYDTIAFERLTGRSSLISALVRCKCW